MSSQKHGEPRSRRQLRGHAGSPLGWRLALVLAGLNAAPACNEDTRPTDEDGDGLCANPGIEASNGAPPGSNDACGLTAYCDERAYGFACTYDECVCSIDGDVQLTLPFEPALCGGIDGVSLSIAREACSW